MRTDVQIAETILADIAEHPWLGSQELHAWGRHFPAAYRSLFNDYWGELKEAVIKGLNEEGINQ